jgi:hypothetical protein
VAQSSNWTAKSTWSSKKMTFSPLLAKFEGKEQ